MGAVGDDHWIGAVNSIEDDEIDANKPFTVYTSRFHARKSRNKTSCRVKTGLAVNLLFGAMVAGASVMGSLEGTKDTKLGHHIHSGGSWVHRKARGVEAKEGGKME